jgi:hypothetical protein
MVIEFKKSSGSKTGLYHPVSGRDPYSANHSFPQPIVPCLADFQNPQPPENETSDTTLKF